MLRAPPGLRALPPARGDGAIHCGPSPSPENFTLYFFISHSGGEPRLTRSCLCAFPTGRMRQAHSFSSPSSSPLYLPSFISLRFSREPALSPRVFYFSRPSRRASVDPRDRGGKDVNTWKKLALNGTRDASPRANGAPNLHAEHFHCARVSRRAPALADSWEVSRSTIYSERRSSSDWRSLSEDSDGTLALSPAAAAN